jgi:predicted DNA-binding protein (MmcQ/YjbR family)
MNKTGAEQSVHSDWKATQIKVADVLFAMVKEVEGRPAASLKTSPELADLLRQQHSDVRPSKHLNKAHWSTVYLDGSLPDSQIYYLVDAQVVPDGRLFASCSILLIAVPELAPLAFSP